MTGEPRRNRAAYVRALASELYVLVVAGVLTGAIVIGVGSRLAMFALRLTSPAYVDGIESDDGFTIGRFTIGRFTLSGTYNLLLLSAAAGVIGAAAYQWVRPWLIGPRWFRLLTLALGSGAVVGSMLVHADGIDFTVLEPMWFAVALFVALPALFAVSIALAVDLLDRQVEAGRPRTWRGWILPIVLVAAFPLVLFVLVFAIGVLIVWVAVRDQSAVRNARTVPAVAMIVRIAWLAIAVLGLVALLGDISDLRAIA